MTPIKKILVPVDFSASSDEAIQFAGDLSRRYEAPLELLHAFHPPTYALPEGYVVPTGEQYKAIMEALHKQLTAAEAKATAAGAVFVHSTLKDAGTVSEILREAKEGAYDLIVMGTHGRSGLKHMLVGSVAENVVRSAPCPVITVRGRA